MKSEAELNEEFKLLNYQIRELNKQRFNIYKQFKLLNPIFELKEMRIISIYHDFYCVDVDEIKLDTIV